MIRHVRHICCKQAFPLHTSPAPVLLSLVKDALDVTGDTFLFRHGSHEKALFFVAFTLELEADIRVYGFGPRQPQVKLCRKEVQSQGIETRPALCSIICTAR